MCGVCACACTVSYHCRFVIFRGVQESSGAVWPFDPVERGLRWAPSCLSWPRPSLTSTPDMQAMFDKKALTIINFHVNIVSPPEVRMFVFLSAKSLFGVDVLKNSMK